MSASTSPCRPSRSAILPAAPTGRPCRRTSPRWWRGSAQPLREAIASNSRPQGISSPTEPTPTARSRACSPRISPAGPEDHVVGVPAVRMPGHLRAPVCALHHDVMGGPIDAGNRPRRRWPAMNKTWSRTAYSTLRLPAALANSPLCAAQTSASTHSTGWTLAERKVPPVFHDEESPRRRPLRLQRRHLQGAHVAPPALFRRTETGAAAGVAQARRPPGLESAGSTSAQAGHDGIRPSTSAGCGRGGLRTALPGGARLSRSAVTRGSPSAAQQYSLARATQADMKPRLVHVQQPTDRHNSPRRSAASRLPQQPCCGSARPCRPRRPAPSNVTANRRSPRCGQRNAGLRDLAALSLTQLCVLCDGLFLPYSGKQRARSRVWLRKRAAWHRAEDASAHDKYQAAAARGEHITVMRRRACPRVIADIASSRPP